MQILWNKPGITILVRASAAKSAQPLRPAGQIILAVPKGQTLGECLGENDRGAVQSPKMAQIADVLGF